MRQWQKPRGTALVALPGTGEETYVPAPFWGALAQHSIFGGEHNPPRRGPTTEDVLLPLELMCWLSSHCNCA